MKLLGRPGTPAASSPLGRPGTPSPACKLDGKWYKELGNQWKSGQTWWGIYVWSIMKTRCKCHKIIQHHLSRAQYHSTTLNCQHPIAVFFPMQKPLAQIFLFFIKNGPGNQRTCNTSGTWLSTCNSCNYGRLLQLGHFWFAAAKKIKQCKSPSCRSNCDFLEALCLTSNDAKTMCNAERRSKGVALWSLISLKLAKATTHIFWNLWVQNPFLAAFPLSQFWKSPQVPKESCHQFLFLVLVSDVNLRRGSMGGNKKL